MLQTKDLVSMRDINAEDINEILKNAEFMKQILLSGNKKAPASSREIYCYFIL